MPPKPRLILGAGLMALGLWGLWQMPQAQSGPKKTCRVLKIYDGDTFGCDFNGNQRVDGKPEHVRMLGIDTPEMGYSRKSKTHRDAPLAAEAKQWLSDHIVGKTVRLVYDVRPTDKYRRQLAHVYRSDQTVSLNQQLLQMGYARLMFIAPNKSQHHAYTQALQTAQQKRLGLWQHIY
jgi:micrococcal nuclease